MVTYYLYRLVNSLIFDKCGATQHFRKRCNKNYQTHGSQSIITILETMEGPNTPEYWQVVGDREWELADEYGYPRGDHYRSVMIKASKGGFAASNITTKAQIQETKTTNGSLSNGGLSLKGTTKSEEWKAQQPWLKSHEIHMVKTECPHCNKSVDKRNYGRWHGDKCKLA